MEDFTRGDISPWIISAAGIGGVPVRGRLKLQNMLFLLTYSVEEIGRLLDYAPGPRGPHSDIVDRELGRLVGAGIVSEGPGGISLADPGKEADARERVDPEILDELEECKEMLNDLTDEELLAFMYLTFPEMAVASPEYERIRRMEEPLIMSLVKKDKISSQRAAELLGVTQSHIFHNMNRMGMRVFY
ncbi:MAG: hypothetical protein MPJ06_02515 [Nitrosopumilus sp.]|nr:hypothetical protein [Nitrosopumilus sp.]MDA7942871.1 hypothetical protein [Nitrosopumilus sp.]MDA7998776.1 hypothetical protein [Nitrosopumilus sp.]